MPSFFTSTKMDRSGVVELDTQQILVVEDSPTVLHQTTKMLTDGGYTVLTAADGEEAVQLVLEQKPSLVLLDVILPKLNGYQVCRQIKSIPETADIPVIMITGKAKDSDRHWGMEQGADEYITKPFEADELLVAVGHFVSKVTGKTVTDTRQTETEDADYAKQPEQ